MQASEAAFMQRGDIIRLHANIIHGMLSIYPYHIFRIPADTQPNTQKELQSTLYYSKFIERNKFNNKHIQIY